MVLKRIKYVPADLNYETAYCDFMSLFILAQIINYVLVFQHTSSDITPTVLKNPTMDDTDDA